MNKSTPEQLMQPRFLVIGNYPHSPYKIGDIVDATLTNAHLTTTDVYDSFDAEFKPTANYFSINKIKDFPALFKQLEWWKERSLDELIAVKYVRVIKYVGYWRVGDIVPVSDWKIEKGKFVHYVLKYNHWQIAETVEPATEAQYLKQQNKDNGNNSIK